MNNNIKKELESKFVNFLSKHDWDKKTEIACTYSFFHILNLIEELEGKENEEHY